MTANIETMFYVKEKPWHGMGTKVETAVTSADALHLAGLDWIVEPKPVYVENNGIFGTAMEAIPGYVANTRNADGQVLGIVTDSYKIVQNTDAFQFTDNLVGGDVRYETAGSLANGKRVWLLAKLPDTEIVGDKVERFLVFTNTFDGSGAVRVACTPIRVVCQNTLNYALHTAKRSWSVRHTANIHNRIAEAQQALQLENRYVDALNRNANTLARQHLSDYQLDSLVYLQILHLTRHQTFLEWIKKNELFHE